jgi:hypothetical protein
VLSSVERERWETILRELNSFWILQETKDKHRSRDRNIIEGDRNTAYSHVVSNQRRRKKLIHVLDGPEGPVTESKDMFKVATYYYKHLFKFEDRPDIRLQDNLFSEEENIMLGSIFIKEEVREAVF